jgi:hypothetical protein
MKSETKNVGITSFCGVASKVYSFIAGDKKAIKGKGVSEALQKKYLSHELYSNVIDGIGLEDAHTCEFGNFSANRLKIKNVRITKKYVSLVDIKSWYGKNGTKPLVFGSVEHLAEIQ